MRCGTCGPARRLVASGLKWAPPWAGCPEPAGAARRAALGQFAGGAASALDALERLIGPLQTRSLLGGTLFMAHGRRPAQP